MYMVSQVSIAEGIADGTDCQGLTRWDKQSSNFVSDPHHEYHRNLLLGTEFELWSWRNGW